MVQRWLEQDRTSSFTIRKSSSSSSRTEDLTNLVTPFSHLFLNVNFGAERGIAHSEVIVPAQTSIPQDLMHMWETNRVGLTDVAECITRNDRSRDFKSFDYPQT